MLAEQIIKYIENWAPPGAAWEKDNVGLQVGSPKISVSNIFLTLELTANSLNEAIKKNCNFIFTHHPFLFKPLTKIDTANDEKGRLIHQLIKNNITLFSAHTNLDFTKEGVSFELAKVLGLQNSKFLENEENNQLKFVVFVPQKNLKEVSEALFDAGAGIIGEYEKCSFITKGTGTFKGNENTNPATGKKEILENVEEIRLELLVDSWNLNKVINSLKKVHPYEEPAYDIYQLKNKNVNYGFGVIGELNKSMTTNEFLKHTSKSLRVKNLRYTNGKKGKIKKVAVCGGSGSELLIPAIKNGADAFITADIKYHVFQEGENKILFIDAGHYETEIHSLNIVKNKLESFLKKNNESIKIYKYTGTTNPVRYFNSN